MARRKKATRSGGKGDVRSVAPSVAATPSPVARLAEFSNQPVAIAALMAIVVLCYLPALGNGFVYDDVPLIVTASTPHGWREIAGLLVQGHWNNLPYYRPLPRLALGMEKIAFGDRATGYHFMNAVLMALAATAAFAILRRPILRIPLSMAWLAAALFALHPVASDTVYPASAGPETLMYIIALLGAVYAFLRPGWRSYAVAMLLLAAALLSKEQAIVAPLLFLLADLSGLSADAPVRRWSRWPEWLKRYAPVAAVVVGYFLVRSYFVAKGASEKLAITMYPEGPLMSLLYTLQTIFAPAFELVYEPRKTYWLVPFRQALWVAGAALLASAIARHRRELGRQIWFFVGWPFIAFLPTANFFLQETQFAERYVFLPYFGVVGVAALVASRLAKTTAVRERAVLAGMALVGLAAGISIFRGTYYRDEETFLKQWAKTDPQPVRALAMLGEDRFRAGNVDAAIATYREAINANPKACSWVYEPLGRALEAKGRLGEAIENYRRAVELRPDDSGAARSLQLALRKKGAPNDASTDELRQLVSEPTDAIALLNLGVAADGEGRSDDALRYFRQAVAREPQSALSDADRTDLLAKAHYNIGRVLARRGDTDAAVREYQRALELNPQYAYAHTNLGLLLLDGGRVDEAILHFEAALRTNPHLTIAQSSLDRARERKRQPGPNG
jgi:tetratricopeptide (TPR) repeat protein